jgi:hypothetical protein
MLQALSAADLPYADCCSRTLGLGPRGPAVRGQLLELIRDIQVLDAVLGGNMRQVPTRPLRIPGGFLFRQCWIRCEWVEIGEGLSALHCPVCGTRRGLGRLSGRCCLS